TEAIVDSIQEMARVVQGYVPGYRITAPVQVTPGAGPDGEDRIAVFIQVTGAADYLPVFAGNLDIITAAAIATAERIQPAIVAAHARCSAEGGTDDQPRYKLTGHRWARRHSGTC